VLEAIVDKWSTLSAYGLLLLLIVLNGGSLAAALVTAPSATEAWDEIGDHYAPSNFRVHLRNLSLFLPAIGIFLWRDRRRRQYKGFGSRR
jgi:hypothetical protein